MKRRRVKITGIGPVTPAGIGKEEFWKGILEPVSRVRVFKSIDEQYGEFVAAYLDDFDITKYVNRSRVQKNAARHTLFAIVGTSLAIKDAGITPRDLVVGNCAVVSGSTLMDFGGILSSIDSIGKSGVRGAQPRVLSSMGPGSVSTALNQVLEITARTVALSNQCCSGLDAIGYGASLIEKGVSDIVICGGTDAPLHRFPLIELRAAGLTPATSDMPGRVCRPFDLWRTTGVVSEGACMFVLEPDSSPRPGYCYVSGYAFANDEPGEICSGMTTAGKLAAADAGIVLSEINAISAWGPGHKMIDLGEAKALVQMFGAGLPDIPSCSIKGAIGSALGAAPAIQVAAVALGLTFAVIPPTVNWDYPDPDCPLHLSGRARSVSHNTVLVNSHGIGTLNSSMILQKCC